MKKVILGIGALTTVVAPIATAVSCNNDGKLKGIGNTEQHFDVEAIDTSAVDSKASYSVDSLLAEAKEIGWTNQVFKNGITYEGMSQQINLLIQIALAEGMDLKTALGETKIIDDAIASMSQEDAFTKLGVDLANQNAQNSFYHLSKISVDVNASSAANAQDVASLYPGNGTIDGDSDFTRGLFTSPEKAEYSDAASLGGKFDLAAYYDNSNGKRDQVTFVGNRGDETFVRELRIKNVALQYPIISATKMTNEYLPIVKATLYKYVSMMVNLLDGLGVAGIGPDGEPVIRGVPPFVNIPSVLVSSINYIISQNWDATNKLIKIDDKKLGQAIENINNQRSVNFLAIKAIYLGLDKTFMSSNMAFWVRQDRFKDSKFDGVFGLKSVDPKAVGLADLMAGYDDQQLNDCSPAYYVMREWNSAKSFMNFNPAEDISQNQVDHGTPVAQ